MYNLVRQEFTKTGTMAEEERLEAEQVQLIKEHDLDCYMEYMIVDGDFFPFIDEDIEVKKTMEDGTVLFDEDRKFILQSSSIREYKRNGEIKKDQSFYYLYKRS